MACFRSKGLLMFLSALLFLITCGTRGQSAPRLANTPGWTQTPYERNSLLFASEQEAVQALGSPDILMRRSGVQWLGQWTGTVYGASPNQAHDTILQSQTSLVPLLIRAVGEMPDADSQQAARLLAVMGETAQLGIPAICAEIVSSDYGDGTPEGVKDFSACADLTTSLAVLSGGPDDVSAHLIQLLQSSNPNTRRVVAGTMGFRASLLANRRSGDFLAFDRQAIPALALGLDDPVLAVRLAAAHSLESLTYGSGQAPWQKALPSLTRALASTDPILRQTAARTLALVPTDTSPVAAALRDALHGTNKAVISYVITALSHAAWSDPGKTLDAFLPDLKSTNLEQRRQATADIYCAESAFWGIRSQAGYEPILDENDNISTSYNSRQMSWSLEVDNDIPPSQIVARAGWRRTAGATVMSRLLAALVQATSDPDHAVRIDAARNLEKIGQWTYSGLESGSRPNPAAEAKPEVITALGKAAEALRWYEPLLSSSLRDLQSRVTRGPGGTA